MEQQERPRSDTILKVTSIKRFKDSIGRNVNPKGRSRPAGPIMDVNQLELNGRKQLEITTERLQGTRLALQQIRALHSKRFQNLRRSKKSLMFEILPPIFFVALSAILLFMIPRPADQPPLEVNLEKSVFSCLIFSCVFCNLLHTFFSFFWQFFILSFFLPLGLVFLLLFARQNYSIGPKLHRQPFNTDMKQMEGVGGISRRKKINGIRFYICLFLTDDIFLKLTPWLYGPPNYVFYSNDYENSPGNAAVLRNLKDGPGLGTRCMKGSVREDCAPLNGSSGGISLVHAYSQKSQIEVEDFDVDGFTSLSDTNLTSCTLLASLDPLCEVTGKNIS